MHITSEQIPDHCAIQLNLRGDFDTFSFQRFLDEVRKAAAALVLDPRPGQKLVLVNLHQVPYINSTALGALISAYRDLQRKGVELRIFDPSRYAADMIGKVGLDGIISVRKTLEEALVVST